MWNIEIFLDFASVLMRMHSFKETSINIRVYSFIYWQYHWIKHILRTNNEYIFNLAILPISRKLFISILYNWSIINDQRSSWFIFYLHFLIYKLDSLCLRYMNILVIHREVSGNPNILWNFMKNFLCTWM